MLKNKITSLTTKKITIALSAAGMLLNVFMSAAVAETEVTNASGETAMSEVALTVTDIRRLEGHLLISIFSGEENYSENIPSESKKVKVTSEEQLVVFKGLEVGEYGIKIIHDDNDNNKLDTNALGIPKEGYGFSNNGGAFGPSPWREAKFAVKDTTELSITLH